jgi:hypothetical protein
MVAVMDPRWAPAELLTVDVDDLPISVPLAPRHALTQSRRQGFTKEISRFQKVGISGIRPDLAHKKEAFLSPSQRCWEEE